MTDREKGQRAAERTFAILTATYHELPERDALIAELTEDEARDVVRLMAQFLRGSLVNIETLAHVPPGTALPVIVERLREVPWFQ